MSEAADRKHEIKRHWAEPGGRHDAVIRATKFGLPIVIVVLLLLLAIAPFERRGDVSFILDKNKAELDRAIQVLPIKLNKVGRTAIYGSWFNFYLCEYSGQIRVGGQALEIPPQKVGSERCDLP